MNHDPYKPPQTVVGDIAAPVGTRPRSINIAVVLLAFYITIAGLLDLGEVARLFATMRKMELVIALWSIAKVGIAIWLCVAIARGANWARITWLILILASLALFLAMLWYGMNVALRAANVAPHPRLWIRQVLTYATNLFVLYLLFFPGKQWFKR